MEVSSTSLFESFREKGLWVAPQPTHHVDISLSQLTDIKIPLLRMPCPLPPGPISLKAHTNTHVPPTWLIQLVQLLIHCLPKTFPDPQAGLGIPGHSHLSLLSCITTHFTHHICTEESDTVLALEERKCKLRASLVVQWLRIHLPMQGTQVRALVQEDPTCHGATKPVHHNY